MVIVNYLKEKIRSGVPVIGTWCVIPSPVVANIIAKSGMDFLIIDMEHGPIGFETAQQMVLACESFKTTPLIRVPYVSKEHISRALDLGAHGLHVPEVTCVDDVRKIIDYSMYSPKGSRGFSPFTKAGGYTKNSQFSSSIVNESLFLSIHIEGKDAVHSIEEILSIDEVDVVFLGLFDLSNSFGVPGQTKHPLVIEFVEKAIVLSKSKGKTIGTIVCSEDELKMMKNLGVGYFTYSVDCSVLIESYDAVRSQFDVL